MRNVVQSITRALCFAALVRAIGGQAAADIPPPPTPIEGPDVQSEVVTSSVVVAYQRDAETVRVIIPRRYLNSSSSRLMVAGIILAATVAVGGLAVILVRHKSARSAAVAGSVVLLAVVVLSGAAVWLTLQTAAAEEVGPEDSGKLFLVTNVPEDVTIETSETDDRVWVILPETNLKLKRPPYRRFPRPRPD